MKYDALGQLEQSLLLAIPHRGEGYCGDEHRVRHIVVNLLTNAIKWGASELGRIGRGPAAAMAHPWHHEQARELVELLLSTHFLAEAVVEREDQRRPAVRRSASTRGISKEMRV